MSFLKLVSGIILVIVGAVFVNPFVNGVANFCTTLTHDRLLYDPGCNIHWSDPTYPIFVPLFVGGIVLIGWAVKDMQAPPQIQQR
jgi:hypothetical protein